jgi:hypothetical protein
LRLFAVRWGSGWAVLSIGVTDALLEASDRRLADVDATAKRLLSIDNTGGRSLRVPDELAEMCLAFEVRENMSAP